MNDGFVIAVMDGKARRIAREREICTRDRILAKVRALMGGGILRPRLDEVCTGIVTAEAINRHFLTFNDLLFAAVEDSDTRGRVLRRLMPHTPLPSADECDRILRAIIVGRGIGL